MSEAAETLDGWYSLHLFYAVDWTTFRLIAEDDREAMITELETFIKDKTVARESHQGDHAIYNITGQKRTFYYGFTSRNERVKSN